MSEEPATAQWKQFLETAPPNTPVEIQGLVRPHTGPEHHQYVVKSPVIELHCERDDGPRNFGAEDLRFWGGPNFRFVTYKCLNCREKTKTFALVIESDCDGNVEAMKLGEFPPFATPIPPRAKRLLDKPNLDLYRKGNRAIDHGLGIGAASYFRRIIENQWGLLVEELRDAAKQLGVTNLSAYDEARASKQFSSAVESLKNVIPKELLILNGHNPLTLLHQLLSKHLHSLTDEQFLEQAQATRLVLDALIERIEIALRDRKKLQAAVKTLQQN